MDGARGVRCCVCMEPVQSPHSLFCLNVYCSRCLSDVIAMSEGTFDGSVLDATTHRSALTYDGPTRRSRSPERQHQPSDTEVEDEQSFALARVPGVNNEIVIECGNCRGENRVAYASTWCRECNMGYCQQCLQHHQRVKVTACHRLVPAGQADLQEELRRGQDLMCPNHGKPLAFFCQDHGSLACPRCVFERHRSCPRVQEACSASHQIKRDVVRRLPDLEKALADLRRCRREMMYEEARVSQDLGQVRQLIGERAEAWVERIRQHQAEMERRALEQSQLSEQALSQTRRQLELQTCAVAEAVELMRRLQVTSDPVDVVRGAALVAGPLGFPSIDPPRVPRIEPLTLRHHPEVDRVLNSTLSLGRMTGGIQGTGRGGWVQGRGRPPTPPPQPALPAVEKRPEPEKMWVGPLPGYELRTKGGVKAEETKTEPARANRSRGRSMGRILVEPRAQKFSGINIKVPGKTRTDSSRDTAVTPGNNVRLPRTSPGGKPQSEARSWCENFGASHRFTEGKVLGSTVTEDSGSSRLIYQRIGSKLVSSLTRNSPQLPLQPKASFSGTKAPQVYRKTYLQPTLASAVKGGNFDPSENSQRLREPVDLFRRPSPPRQSPGAGTPSSTLSSNSRRSSLPPWGDLDSLRMAFGSVPTSASSDEKVCARREQCPERRDRPTSRQRNELKSALAQEKAKVENIVGNRSLIRRIPPMQSEGHTSKPADSSIDSSQTSSGQSDSRIIMTNENKTEKDGYPKQSPLTKWLQIRRLSQDTAPPKQGSAREHFVSNIGTEVRQLQAPGTSAEIPIRLAASNSGRPLASRPSNNPRPGQLFRKEERQGGSTTKGGSEKFDGGTRVHPTSPTTTNAPTGPQSSPGTSKPNVNGVRREQGKFSSPVKMRDALRAESSSSSYESSLVNPPPTLVFHPPTSGASLSSNDATSGESLVHTDSSNSGSERRVDNVARVIGVLHQPRPAPRNSQSLPLPGQPPPQPPQSSSRKRRTPSRSPQRPVALKVSQSQVAARDLVGMNRSGNQGPSSSSQLTCQVDSSSLKDVSSSELSKPEVATSSSSSASVKPKETKPIVSKTPKKTFTSNVVKKDPSWEFSTRPVTPARFFAKRKSSVNVPQQKKTSAVANTSKKQDSEKARAPTLVDASTSAQAVTITTSTSPDPTASSQSTKSLQTSPEPQQLAEDHERPSLQCDLPAVPCNCQAPPTLKIRDPNSENSHGSSIVQSSEVLIRRYEPSPCSCAHFDARNRRARSQSKPWHQCQHSHGALFDKTSSMESIQTDGATIELSAEGATAAEGQPITGSSAEYNVQMTMTTTAMTNASTSLPSKASSWAWRAEGVKIPVSFGPVCGSSSCCSGAKAGYQNHNRCAKHTTGREKTAKNSGDRENKRQVLK